MQITAKLICREFNNRGIKYRIISDTPNLIEFEDEQGSKRFLTSCVSDKVSAVSLRLANNKNFAGLMAQICGVNSLKTLLWQSSDRIEVVHKFIEKNGRCIVKPLDAAHGNGVTINIDSLESLDKALAKALNFSDSILVQPYFEGDDIRVLVIDGKYTAASRRQPASVVGNGINEIADLIELENQNTQRGSNYTKSLNFISTEAANAYLSEELRRRVPDIGEEVRVVGVGNIGMGGKSYDVTDELPQQIQKAAEKLAASSNLPYCGVDFLYNQQSGDYVFIEINAAASFGLHEFPTHGKPRNVSKIFVDWLLS